MVRVARRYRFSASHRLHTPQLSAGRNQEIYGKCNNPYGHGHDYLLEVIVEGEPDLHSGLVVPLAILDQYVRATVLADFDHKNMNEQIPAFRNIPPTTENVVVEIERRLQKEWKFTFPVTPSLAAVRIFETQRNIVELNRVSKG